MDRYYVGSTADVERRRQQHNSGKRRHYTSKAHDWELKYQQPFPTRALAQRREREIKRMKSRAYIQGLIDKAQEI